MIHCLVYLLVKGILYFQISCQISFRKCKKIIQTNLLIFFSDTDNQRVIIKVKDVNDEPPYFINRPLPMQAVVKLNAAPNSPVFTLQAKDPDTDHNLHYFLVRLVRV